MPAQQYQEWESPEEQEMNPLMFPETLEQTPAFTILEYLNVNDLLTLACLNKQWNLMMKTSKGINRIWFYKTMYAWKENGSILTIPSKMERKDIRKDWKDTFFRTVIQVSSSTKEEEEEIERSFFV